MTYKVHVLISSHTTQLSGLETLRRSDRTRHGNNAVPLRAFENRQLLPGCPDFYRGGPAHDYNRRVLQREALRQRTIKTLRVSAIRLQRLTF